MSSSGPIADALASMTCREELRNLESGKEMPQCHRLTNVLTVKPPGMTDRMSQ